MAQSFARLLVLVRNRQTGLFLTFRNVTLPPLCGRQKLKAVLVDPCMARSMLELAGPVIPVELLMTPLCMNLARLVMPRL